MMTPVSHVDPYVKSSTESHDPFEIPREDFEEYDRDRDGVLSQKEFHRALLRRYGYCVLGYSQLIMDTFDSKKDGKIDFEEYLEFYAADRKADNETKEDLNKWADSIVCFGCSCFLCTAGLSCLPLYLLTRENYDTYCDPHYSVYFIKGPEARCEAVGTPPPNSIKSKIMRPYIEKRCPTMPSDVFETFNASTAMGEID